MRATLRKFGLGRAAYRFYHAPIAAVRESLAAGGPLEQWRTAAGRRAMKKAATKLPPPNEAGQSLPLHLLSGNQFWYQTIFCLWSFTRQTRRPVAAVIYDDGSLDDHARQAMTRVFPLVRFRSKRECIERLDAHLPATQFPVLRDRWENYPNIRKLIDVHVAGTGWKLVLDSDLLFFRRPDFLLDWLEAPRVPLHATDTETSYGYSRPLLRELAGTELRERVNVGLCGLRSEELDWEKLEYWCRTLLEREGTSYYLEQALVALLTAGRECCIAPEADYVTLPQPPEAQACTAVMHHYVAESKRWYFRHNWQRALAAAP
ncbi:MAG: glycosyl transferase family 2 [Opitutaceae bacterium]|nr:glycosyl transferase family 2 [Opitutaceae bacterium]